MLAGSCQFCSIIVVDRNDDIAGLDRIAQLPDKDKADRQVDCGCKIRPASTQQTRGFAHRGKLDGNQALIDFADTLERVVVETVESGHMTKDLALLVGDHQSWLTTEGFLDKVAENLNKAMA